MKKVIIITMIGILSLSIFLPSYICGPSNLLEMQEGMKYVYNYNSPQAGFSSQTDTYITKVNNEVWEGIVVVTIEYSGETTRAYRFKITKENYDIFETTYLREKTIYAEDVEYRQLDSDSSQSNINKVFVMLLYEKLYDFDMESLIQNKVANTTWYDGYPTELTLEGPVTYNGYESYKITATIEGNELMPSGINTYYVSTVFPYILISFQSSYGGVEYNLQETEQKSFIFSEYNIDEAANYNPEALFNYTVDGFSVEFDASLSYDKDGTISSYSWDFDDDTNASEVSVTHEYQNSGRYTVKLHVTDDEGGKSSEWKFIDIQDTSDTGNEKQNNGSGTPGFEIILIVCAITLILFLKRKRIN